MADVTRYVNINSTAGGTGLTNATTGTDRAYASLAEWEADEDGLSSVDQHHQVIVTGIERRTDSLLVNGWASGVRIDVEGHPDCKAGAKPQGAGLESSQANRTILQYVFMNFEDVAIINTGGGSAIQYSTVDIDKQMYRKNCYFDGPAGFVSGYTADGGEFLCENCIFNNSGDMYFSSIASGETFTINLNNCGIIGGRIVHQNYTTLNARNTFSDHTDFHLGQGTYTGAITNAEHCAFAENVNASHLTTDSDNIRSVNFTDYYENEDYGIFVPTDDATNLLGQGDNTLTGTPANDANGFTRPASCDIGPFENYDRPMLRAVGTLSAASGAVGSAIGDLTPGDPDGVAVGDLLILFVNAAFSGNESRDNAYNSGSSLGFDAPEDWTHQNEQDYWYVAGRLHVFTKIADGTATDSVTLSHNDSTVTGGWKAQIVRIEAHHATTFWDDFQGSDAGLTEPMVHPAATASDSYSLAFVFGGGYQSETGITEIDNGFQLLTDDPANDSFWLGSKVVESGGTGTTNARNSTSLSRCGTSTIVIAPATTTSAGTEITGTLESVSLSTFQATVDAGTNTEIDGTLESVNVTENQATIASDRDISGTLESVLVTELAGAIALDRDIQGALESLSLNAPGADVALDREVQGSLESVLVNALAAGIGSSRDISGNLESVQVETNQASIASDRDIQGSLESVSLTSNAAEINLVLRPPTEAITLSTLVASITGDVALSAGLESIELQGLQGNVASDRDVVGDLESLLVTTLGSTVVADFSLVSGFESIVLSELASQVSLDIDLDATLQSITVTEFGTEIRLDRDIQVTLQSLTLSTFSAILDIPTTMIDLPGIEYTMPENRVHFSLADSKIHFTLPEGRIHFTFSNED